MVHEEAINMDTDLKDGYFDVVVVGTGLAESILAALLASNGKSVLHLDSKPFYGGDWATLSLSKLKSYFASCYLSENGVSEPKKTPTELQDAIRQNEHFQQYTDIALLPVLENSSFSDVQIVDSAEEWLNRAMVDLTPQIILGNGETVDMLVQTQAASYLEFRGVDEIFWLDESGQLQKVPTSRNDIFRSMLLTPVEKRIFMKFLKTCAVYEPSLFQYEGHDGGILSAGQVVNSSEEIAEMEQVQKWCDCSLCLDNWLDELHFTDRLKHYVFALLGCCGEKYESCAVATAVERISQYCCAVQRFRISSGFLYSKYGSGDICEALCRRCAIHGGVYLLRRQVTYLICDSSSQVIGLVTGNGDLIRCSVVIGSTSLEVKYTDSSWTRRISSDKGRWKLYLILDRPVLLPGKGVDLFTSHLVVQSQNNESCLVEGIQVEQQVDSVHTVYVIYLSCDDVENGKIALLLSLQKLMHPIDSHLCHSSSDLWQLLKQFPGLKYACIGFCRDWEPIIQLGHYYSCYLTKDIHSIQTQIDQVFHLYDYITHREWQS